MQRHCRGTKGLWVSLPVKLGADFGKLLGLDWEFTSQPCSWDHLERRECLLDSGVTVLWRPCYLQLSALPLPRNSVLLGLRFNPTVDVLGSVILLSLLKPSVGGCGAARAWPDRVTWNTGSEHKQGHCSLKKKTWQKQSGSDALAWNGNEESDYSILCIESKKKKKCFCFALVPQK